MNIKEIKNKIYAILDIQPLGDESALLAAIDSAARKIAVYARCIRKSEKLTFCGENGAYSAQLPSDFAVFGYIRRGMRVWSREHFEIMGEKIKSTALVGGEYELFYFAYPPSASAAASEDTELFADRYVCDAVAYGAAMELCESVYASDVQRYMRISTEYDERMANMISSAVSAVRVANGFFGRMRGVFF